MEIIPASKKPILARTKRILAGIKIILPSSTVIPAGIEVIPASIVVILGGITVIRESIKSIHREYGSKSGAIRIKPWALPNCRLRLAVGCGTSCTNKPSRAIKICSPATAASIKWGKCARASSRVRVLPEFSSSASAPCPTRFAVAPNRANQRGHARCRARVARPRAAHRLAMSPKIGRRFRVKSLLA